MNLSERPTGEVRLASDRADGAYLLQSGTGPYPQRDVSGNSILSSVSTHANTRRVCIPINVFSNLTVEALTIPHSGDSTLAMSSADRSCHGSVRQTHFEAPKRP